MDMNRAARPACLLFLLLAAPVAGAATFDFSQLDSYVPTAVDHLRDRIQLHRSSGDERAWRAGIDSLLDAAPLDLWACEEVARWNVDQGQLGTLTRALESGQVEGLPRQIQDDPDLREYLLCRAYYMRGRGATAHSRLGRLLERRPDWTLAWRTRGVSAVDLGRPRTEWLEDFRRATADPTGAAAALNSLAYFREGTFPTAEAAAITVALPRLALVPWVAESFDQVVVLRRLAREDVTAAWCDSAWIALQARHGDRLDQDYLARAVYNALPPGECLSLIDQWESRLAHGSPGRLELQLLRIEILQALSDYAGAHQRLVELPNSPRVAAAWLEQGLLEREAEVLRRDLQLLDEEGGLLWAAGARVQGWSYLGATDPARSVQETLELESPSSHLWSRMSTWTPNEAPEVRDFADSLLGVGACALPTELVTDIRREAVGDTLPASETLGTMDIAGRTWGLIALARLAATEGRRNALLAEAERAAANSWPNTISLLQYYTWNAKGDRAEAVLERLEALAPQSLSVHTHRMSLEVARGRGESTEQAFRSLVRRPGWWHVPIYSLPMYGGQHDPAFVDSLVVLLTREGSANPRMRYLVAMQDLGQGRHGAAHASLEKLSASFPGLEMFRTALLSSGGSPQQLPPDDGPVDGAAEFEPFGHDLESTDWILQSLRKPGDLQRGSDAAYLLVQRSLVSRGDRGYATRQRQVVHILGNSGLEAFGTIRVPFRGGTGIPVVRVARVIHPDGTVVPVPRADIVVGNRDNAEVDVHDLLELKIPVNSLRPGSAFDLAFDVSLDVLFESGWAHRYMFGMERPILEERFELLGDSTMVVREFGGVVASRSEKRGAQVLRTWSVNNRLPIVIPESAPDLSDEYPGVGVSTHRDWGVAAEKARAAYWARAVANDTLLARVTEVTRGLKSPADRFEALYRWVRDDFHYLAISLGWGGYVPRSAPEVLRRGYGDCKDKVILLLTALRAVGIPAEPVLVIGQPEQQIRADLVDPFGFNHVILRAVAGGDTLWCDPTTQYPRTGVLSPSLCGTLGLVLPESGPARLARLPEAQARDHGLETEITVTPISQSEARYEVVSRFRGEPAVALLLGLNADSTLIGDIVDRFLRYGLPLSSVREEWSRVDTSADPLVIRAVYRDTSFSAEGQNSAGLRIVTEVADPGLVYPDPRTRTSDLLLSYPFHGRALVTYRDAAGWERFGSIAPVTVQGPFFDGRFRPDGKPGSGDGYVVELEFEVRDSRLTPDEYRSFHASWLTFQTGQNQVVGYRKTLPRDDVARFRNYVRDNPGDTSFATMAALQLLGSDIGGEGAAGKDRRRLARELLEPIIAVDGGSPMPLLALARIEMVEGHYRRADSLIAAADAREPGTPVTESLALACDVELEQYDEAIPRLNKLIDRYASRELMLGLITLLYSAGRAEEARRQESRYLAFPGVTDSSAILMARLLGAMAADDCNFARSSLAGIRAQPGLGDLSEIESSFIVDCSPVAEAVDYLETAYMRDPTNATVCNNLAWFYALAGRELDRAEELARIAVSLSAGSSMAGNTLAVVQLRQGKLDEAARFLRELVERDDRPAQLRANRLYLGLCEYLAGRTVPALRLWETVASGPESNKFVRHARAAIQAARSGGDVPAAIFTH